MNDISEIVISFELIRKVLAAYIVIDSILSSGINMRGDVAHANENAIDFVHLFALDFELIHWMFLSNFKVFALALRIDEFSNKFSYTVCSIFSKSKVVSHIDH